jgi:lysophospholipase
MGIVRPPDSFPARLDRDMAIAELNGTEAYPVPSQAQVAVIRASDGVALRTARWRPTARKGAKGTVLVVGGRAEFIERYSEVVMELRRRGFHVAAFDWRGQGGSDRLTRNPRKGHVRRFADYGLDLDVVFAELMPRLPRPWFVLAHSMGASLCLEAARQGRFPASRLVALAPMIDLALLRRKAAVRVTVTLLDTLLMGKALIPAGREVPLATRPFAGNRLTSDPGRYARNAELARERPELAIGDPTVRWVREALAFMRHMTDPATPLDIRVPSLVIAAGADPVVSTPAIERFSARLKTGLALVLPGARHEILHEVDAVRAAFWAAFDAFIPGELAPGIASPVQKRQRGVVDAPVSGGDDLPAAGG